MNRTDRLVATVMWLQGRRVVRAEDLAAHFEVSVRTVYRDLSSLAEAGVPIVGEAGVGYSLMRGYHLPPVMLTADEALALFLGGEMVRQFTDESLAAPVVDALAKVRSVLPRERQDDLDRLAAGTVVAGRLGGRPQTSDCAALLPVHHAIVSRRVLRLHYRAGDDAETERDVEPLGAFLSSGIWYLVAWCRLRGDLRHFRVDRVQRFELRPERFEPHQDFSLKQHLQDLAPHCDTVTIRVWLSREVVERARRESYHRLTAEVPSGDGWEVSLETFSLDWSARWIVSFGETAEALDPPELRSRVRDIALRCAERHADAVPVS